MAPEIQRRLLRATQFRWFRRWLSVRDTAFRFGAILMARPSMATPTASARSGSYQKGVHACSTASPEPGRRRLSQWRAGSGLRRQPLRHDQRRWHGACSCGAVFRIAADGSHYKTLYSFTGGADGEFPLGALVRDKDGTLYGTAAETFFSYNCDKQWLRHAVATETERHIHRSAHLRRRERRRQSGRQSAEDRQCPLRNHTVGRRKRMQRLRRLTAAARCTSSWSRRAGSTKSCIEFADGTGDGQRPLAGLAQGSEGKLYGTAYEGGTVQRGNRVCRLEQIGRRSPASDHRQL